MMKKKQNGATLIVVLILLLVITVIGTLAIRGSLTALSIATNSQAQQLLLQNSDSALFNVENPKSLTFNLSPNGLFGWIKRDENKGKELVFCYRGSATSFFDVANASAISWRSGSSPTNSELGIDGYCKMDSSNNFFTSGRQAVMTQVMIKVNINSANQVVGLDKAFSYVQLGTDVDSAKIDKAEKIMVVATSIIPSMSSASESSINACFSTHMSQVVIPSGVSPATGMNKSVAECLQELGVPVSTQVAEYKLIQAF